MGAGLTGPALSAYFENKCTKVRSDLILQRRIKVTKLRGLRVLCGGNQTINNQEGHEAHKKMFLKIFAV